jgi:hypothetical protein
MKWVIVSPRVGVPGTEYDIKAAEARGVNVLGLIAGGFIKQSTLIEPKPSKVRKRTKE